MRLCLWCVREHRATAEPRGFGSRSVAIDLAKCTGSDCGITDAQGERETTRKRGTQREEQRRDMMETGVFLWGHMLTDEKVRCVAVYVQPFFCLVCACWEEVTAVFFTLSENKTLSCSLLVPLFSHGYRVSSCYKIPQPEDSNSLPSSRPPPCILFCGWTLTSLKEFMLTLSRHRERSTD